MKAITLFLVPLCLFAQPRPQFVWQGEVDGTIVVHLHRSSATVQIQDGGPVQNQQYRFNDPLPESGQNARLQVLKGRGYAHIIDQPSLDNGYTLSIAIEDRQSGRSPYSIAVFWDASDTAFERRHGKTGYLAWSGRVDEEALVTCQAKQCISSVSRGAPVAEEHYKFSMPLPAQELDVRLEDPEGRGEIRVVEQPRENNHYTATISIRDPQGGASEYSFTLAWRRDAGVEAPLAAAASRGLVWSGTVTGRVQVTVAAGAVFSQPLTGQGVQNEHSDLLRPLPARSGLSSAIQKLRGRGRVAIIEGPSEKNKYHLVFEIDDPGPGAGEYEVELDW
ncbi:MAG TPA: hypothetical protein VMB25_20595 [Bryobacteraceae bacterium]|nr:hypothetical protein [Bryobacteraceae bacterium]